MERGGRPDTFEFAQRAINNGLSAPGDTHLSVACGPTQFDQRFAQAGELELLADKVGIAAAYLDDRTDFFGEQTGQRIATEIVDRKIEAATAGEGHFQQGGDGTTVTAVMVGGQVLETVELLDQIEEGLERLGG